MMRQPGMYTLKMTEADLIRRTCCPACQGERLVPFSREPYDSDTDIHHQRCVSCGLVFMNPLPNQDWYDRLYGEEFWQVKAATQKSTTVWDNKKQYMKQIARAQKYIDELNYILDGRAISNILEVGAAYGLIGTTIARTFGAKAFGAEPNHEARAFATEVAGMTIVAETAAQLDDWAPEQPMDLVIFSHVLENIVDTNATLATVKTKLRPGGLLLIETPNIDWQPSMSIYHPYCFSAASLNLILARNGLSVVRQSTSGRPNTLATPIYLTTISKLADSSEPAANPAVHVASNLRVKTQHFLRKQPFLSKIETYLAARKHLYHPYVQANADSVQKKAETRMSKK